MILILSVWIKVHLNICYLVRLAIHMITNGIFGQIIDRAGRFHHYWLVCCCFFGTVEGSFCNRFFTIVERAIRGWVVILNEIIDRSACLLQHLLKHNSSLFQAFLCVLNVGLIKLITYGFVSVDSYIDSSLVERILFLTWWSPINVRTRKRFTLFS